MNPLRQLFDQIQDVAPAQRRQWLDENCADATLRQRLEQLLRDDHTDPLQLSAAERLARLDQNEAAPTTPLLQWSGRQIGAFRLCEPIGEGGSSVVFRAERIAADFEQQVAVKLLRRGLFSEAEQHWFRRERRVLAQLEHPHVARLIDGGIADEGYPYLVMEYVAGLPLTEHCSRHGLGLRQRLQLFVAVCRAVEAAHRALIVHRDIKPNNLLVTHDGVPKLLDFGIAKLLDDEGEDPTHTGMRALTPEYAAPEQFVGGPITTATDVYALGVVLHELLVGRRPTNAERLRPSALAASADGVVPPHTLRGDLDNIVLKALSQEAPLRYASAGALADDLERHLGGRPVLAHPPSRWYRTKKFVARHRGSVALSSLLLLGVIAALAIALWQGQRAQQEARRADLVRDFLFDVFDSAEDSLPRDARPTPDVLTRLAARRLDEDASLDLATRAQLFTALGRISRAGSAYEQSLQYLDRALSEFQAAGDPLPRERLQAAIERAEVLARLGRIDVAAQTLDALHNEIRAKKDEVAVFGITAEALTALRVARQDDAVNLSAEAISLAREVYGADSKDALEAVFTHGDILCSVARSAECVALLQPALQRWRDAGLPENDRYANSVENVGSAQYALGDMEGAERQFRASLQMLRKIHDPPSEALATNLKNLANTLLQRDANDEAEQTLREADAMYRQMFDPEHPQVLSTIEALGAVAMERRHVDDAAAAFLQVAETCARNTVMDTMPICSRIWQNLSYAYVELKRFDEAEQANTRGLELRRRLVGEQHPSYANSLSGRATIFLERGQYDVALPLLDQALAIVTRAKLGEGESAGVFNASRARALNGLGRPDEAMSALEQAERIFAKIARTDPVRKLRLLVLRGEILDGLGQTTAARDIARQALALAEFRDAVAATRWARIMQLAGTAPAGSGD